MLEMRIMTFLIFECSIEYVSKLVNGENSQKFQHYKFELAIKRKKTVNQFRFSVTNKSSGLSYIFIPASKFRL